MAMNAKPISLHLAEGNPNRLTKAEIAARREAEVKLGATDLSKIKPPPFVQDDTVALAKWRECIKDYKEAAKSGVELLTTSDAGTLALYCKTWSEHISLLNYANPKHDLGEALKLQTAINKKMDMLLKMEDRLFLNPLAKVKNVPRREPAKPANPMEDEYDV